MTPAQAKSGAAESGQVEAGQVEAGQSHPSNRVQRAAAWLRNLTGWRRALAAVASGAVACLSLPPADLLPVLWLAVPAMIWLLDGATSRKAAFWTGWLIGFGYFAVGLYWITFALFVDIARYWWLVPFASNGLAAGLAIFWGAAATVAHQVPADRKLARAALFAASLSLLEWLRGHVLTGFPWNLPGYAWTDYPWLAQSAAALGLYGVTLLALLAPALAAPLGSASIRPRAARAAAAAGIAIMALAALAGFIRVPSEPTPTVPGVLLRLVQPGIAQDLKWVEGRLAENIRRHLDLSNRPAARRPTAIIWPEAAEPYPLAANPELAKALARNLGPGELLITGTLRAVRRTESDPEPEYRNSLEAIDSTGRIVGSYDKFHLVPFGEYMPLSRWLPLAAIAAGGNLGAGPGPATLALPGLPPASPLICYEAIFPHAVTDETSRPDWLLNVTNDAWFGLTAGPHQDFSIARMRTIEEGLPLVRAANNGVSGVADPYGRIVALLDLGQIGIIDTELPRAIAPTLYSRTGDIPFFALVAIIALLTLSVRLRSGTLP